MELNFQREQVADETLTGEVRLTNRHFVRCVFSDACLFYEGGVPPIFEDCVFQRSSVEFRGQPAMTVQFLQALLTPGSGLDGVVAGWFPTLKLTDEGEPTTRH